MGDRLNLKFKAKNEKKKNIILFLIVLLAFFLRVYKINSIPGFLNRDEASIGYNAYSILKTAKDEHNKFLPLFFESFGDWKMPVYIYLTVPFVWLFGLEIYSVRLLSAIAGVLTVLLMYFLVKELFKDYLKSSTLNLTSFLASLLLAINPWHIHYSRQAYEVNLAVFLLSLGVLLFLYDQFFLALLFFIITIYTYHGTIILALFLFAYLTLIKTKSRKRPKLFIYLLILLLMIIAAQSLEQKVVKDKLMQTLVFKDKSQILENVQIPRMMTGGDKNFLTRVFPNKYSEGIFAYLENYSNSFSLSFLFFGNDANERYHINKKSLRLNSIVLLPFYLWGIWLVIKRKRKKELFCLFWLLTVPLLPSLLVRTPSSFRNLPQVIPIIIFSTLGLNQMIVNISKYKIKFVILTILFFGLFVDGLKISIDYIYRLEDGYDNYYKIIVDNFNNLDKNNSLALKISHPEFSPYIFVAFYKKLSPQWFLDNIRWYPVDKEGFRHALSLSEKYQFTPIDWGGEIEPEKVYVDLFQDVPNSFREKSDNSMAMKNKLNIPIFFQFIK